MEKLKYIVEINLVDYLKEKNHLYKVEIFLCDFESTKKSIFNKNLSLCMQEKIKFEILLNKNKDYKILLKITLRGKIEKIEQIIFNTKENYISEKIKIKENKNDEEENSKNAIHNKIQKISHDEVKLFAQNPVSNWRKEKERTSIYHNGKLIFLKGLLENVWDKCYEISSIEELEKKIEGYSIQYIEGAVKILVEKGVLVEYER